jgi:hypothetical protein
VLLLAFGGSGFVLLGAVLVAVFVFNVGRSSKSNTPAASTKLPAGFTLKTYKILPGTHAITLNAKVKWNSFPPTSGPHYYTPAPWGFYTRTDGALNPRITLHNLEHGGIDIFYGGKIPQSQIEAVRTFWEKSPNAIVVAPMPKPDKNTIVPRPVPNLSNKIVLAAWTAKAYGTSRGAVTPGHGFMLTAPRFDEKVFASFRDAHRGKGPERIPVSLSTPGA